MTTKDVAKRDDFAIITQDSAKLQTAISDNLAGEMLNPFDLERVKLPTGGVMTWTVHSIEGENAVELIRGIIVFQKMCRSYFEGSVPSEGTPPDCFSDDGVFGIGEPGGICKKCIFSQWGISRGQSCKLRRFIFLITEDRLLPILISLPPGSLKNAKRYLISDLATHGLSYMDVVTAFRLEKTKNKDGITFSRAVLSLDRTLSDEEKKKVRAYVDAIAPALSTIRVAAEDVSEGDDVSNMG